jgi:hypothetical protein
MTDKKVDKSKSGVKMDHEGFRRMIVQLHKPDINKKHIEKAAGEINKTIKTHFNGTSKGRSMKTMPEEKQTLSTIKEVSSKLLGNASKAASDKVSFFKQRANQKVKDVDSMTDADNKIVKGKEKEADKLSKEINTDRDMADKKAKQAKFFARAAAKKEVKEEAVDEGLGKALAAGALAIGMGAAGSAAITKAYPDKPLHYQVKKIGDKYNVYHKNNIGGKIHFSSDSESKAKEWMKQNEELELDEAKRGRPPKEGSKAWQAAKSKAQSGEGEEQEADKNIVNQMRKKPVGDHHSLTFNNGEKKQVHVQHVNKALSMLSNTPKPADREKLQNSLSHSHDRFMNTIKSGKAIEDAPRAKVSLAKSVREDVDPTTTPAARGAIVTKVVRKPDGSLQLVKTSVGRKFQRDVVDAKEAVTFYDPKKEEEEEKKEKHPQPKGFSVDLTSDSRKKIQADPLASDEKLDIPPTIGNLSAGGEDTTYAGGKYSVAENETLNNLYVDLSEENKQVFNNLILTDEGREKLLQFAKNQGY